MSKHYPKWSGLLSALPWITVLVIVCSHQFDHATPKDIVGYLWATFWFILPTLLFVALMAGLLGRGVGVYFAVLASVLATASVGSLTSSREVPITGAEGTGGVGTVTGEIATVYQAITGVEATGAVGTPGVDVTIALSCILLSCMPGNLGSTGGTPDLPDYLYFHRPYVRQEGH
ncbi:MAG: hypothetical protein ABL921_31585 [Pirellula sp.]